MKKIKVGIAGLGRLGKVHADNLAFKIPNAELTAACSIVPLELSYAKTELGIAEVYSDYRQMLQKADIDAVAIVTTSGEHCWQIAAVERYPKSVFFLGFMRRFDTSYTYAKQKIKEGAIGQPYMVKATGIDPEAAVEGAIRFAGNSGGIFLDMGIHDIDLMRWFLDSDPIEVYAAGTTFKHKEFREAGDDETGAAMYRFENGALGFVHVGRTAAHGYHVETEIIGTEGSLRISPVPEKNLCMVYDKNGAAVECVGGFPERFEQAYLLEMKEFIDCIESERQPDVTVYDGTKSTQIGFATTLSWKNKKAVEI